jgi:hypothetical protein
MLTRTSWVPCAAANSISHTSYQPRPPDSSSDQTCATHRQQHVASAPIARLNQHPINSASARKTKHQLLTARADRDWHRSLPRDDSGACNHDCKAKCKQNHNAKL